MSDRILIVEDEPDVCAALQSFLGRRGFSVSTTPSGRDALELIPAFRPSLILLDITLLDLGGIEVLSRLRQGGCETPVIVMTGQLLPFEEVDRIKAMGVVAYLQKPVVLSQFEALLKEVFGGVVPQEMPGKVTFSDGKETEDGAIHALANALSVIRASSEVFLLNEKDGLYQGKTEGERLEEAKSILKETVLKVEEASGLLEKIRCGSR